MYYNDQTIIYRNGAFLKAKEASIDFFSQSLHYGNAVFEGIRIYQTSSGKAVIFKAREHFDRLKASAEMIGIPYEWNTDELIAATYELLKQNNLQDAYIRPLVYTNADMSFNASTISSIVIAAWEMQPFFGNRLLRVMTSSFQRPNPDAFKLHAKCTGHYINSLLASQEAKERGFDEALLKDVNGFVAEGTGANIFYEKGGKLFTPPPQHILPGITRATVMELCTKLGIAVEEKLFTIEELKYGDAAFFCGTAAEIVGLKYIDGIKFSKIWGNTLCAKIQSAYRELVRQEGKHPGNYYLPEDNYAAFIPAY